ncbi:N-acetylmuramoyl-L-alanine amidase [Clostridium cadaveris]|nr:N-acetylmuramoyl-L-alanine amidase [Clostridium cadaveris]NWK12337.1 N-acetylmuramoyl-L-alanine amidase [Clostridium cadaveris]PWL54036.1 MAG: N-acetylmuramoyl-L-alanine amidase [Clostridium cadaveris]UFH66564.1 N-acetylmuramoyl-L-alanine amidase [Clostridium cadaveris]
MEDTENDKNPKDVENTIEDDKQEKEEAARTKETEKEFEDKTRKTKEKNNITIVIDPGHAVKANLEKEPLSPGSNVMKIKDGGGASGVVTGIPEYKIAMRVAKELNEKLTAKGYNSVMTKTDENLSLGNVERAEIGNKANADLVIRLHCDSFDNASAKGASILIPKGVNENTKAIAASSEKYGKILLDTYCSKMNIKNRGLIYSEDMTGFNWSKVPVVLIEMGFLSNPDEDNMMSESSFPEKSATAISEGIEKIFPR